MRWISSLVVSTLVCLATSVYAQEPEVVPPQEEVAVTSWWWGMRVSAGAEWRGWDADFQAPSITAPIPRMPGVSMGYPGLYPGYGTIQYIDGSISPAPNYFSGLAHFTFMSESQLAPAPHLSPASDFRKVTYHSTIAGRTQLDGSTSYGSDASEDVVAPFILLEYPVYAREDAGCIAFAALRYAYAEGTLKSGMSIFSQSRFSRRLSECSYTYDANNFAGVFDAPHDSRDFGSSSAIVWDADAYAVDAGQFPYENPVESCSTRTVRRTVTGWASQEVEIQQHELLFGGSVQMPVRNGVAVNVLAGATLNFVDWDFSTHARFVDESGVTLAESRTSSSDNKFLAGAVCQVAARVNLTRSGEYFCSLNGGYNWVDKFTVDNDVSSARVDLSSWTAGFAVGKEL